METVSQIQMWLVDQDNILVDSSEKFFADPDPEDPNEVIVPFNGRIVPPLEAPSGKVNRSTGNFKDSLWELVDDLRGTAYWDSEGNRKVISKIGDTVPSGCSTTEPIAQVKSRQSSIVEAACAAQILGGFKSSALGSEFTYPSAFTDQLNLNGSITASLVEGSSNANWMTPFACQDSQGVWDKRSHTAAQIQKVGSDFVAFKLAALIKKDGLLNQIAAATTNDAVAAIVW